MKTKREALWMVFVPACVAILTGLFCVLNASGQAVEEGIARQYPGDRGIEAGPDVLFAENFEDSLSGIVARWTDVKNPDGIAVVNDVPPGSAGSSAVRLTLPSLIRWVVPEYDPREATSLRLHWSLISGAVPIATSSIITGWA